MTLHVKLTRKAALDVAKTYVWLVEKQSQLAADRWRTSLDKAIQDLARRATSYSEAPEAEWLGIDLRELQIGRRQHAYRILFRIRGEAVEILRVRHARQDYLGTDDL